MNRLVLNKLQPLAQRGKQSVIRDLHRQWIRHSSSDVTTATKPFVTHNHPTAPISSFNLRLNSQLRNRRNPARTLRTVLEIVQEIKHRNLKFDCNTYNAIMTAYSQNKELSNVIKTFQNMKTDGLTPNIDTYNILLEAYAKTGRIYDLLRLKEEIADNQIGLTMTSYYHLIKGVSQAQEMELALDLFEDLKGKGLKPNLAIYATLIEGCVGLQDAQTAFELLKEAETVDLAVDSYPRIYMDVLRLGAQCDDAQTVEYCWKKVHAIRPDEGTLLDVLRVAGKKGNTALATDVIRQLSVNGYPYKEHYFTPLMEAFLVKKDLKSAFNVLDIMRVSGVAPTMRATAPIREQLRNDGSVESIDAAYYLLEEIRKQKRSVDVTAFNVVVAACADAKDIERTIATYREAKRLGVTPNVDTYNAVLEACITTQMKSMGQVVIDEMKKADVTPNLETYSNMIRLACTGRDYDEAFEYLEEMKDYNIAPPELCYLILARKLAYENDPRFHMVLEEMETFGYHISPRTRSLWNAKHRNE